VKLLDDADRGIRLAGIYALERIAVDRKPRAPPRRSRWSA
jgi:hypothetical protein